jgi:hypothetical protein
MAIVVIAGSKPNPVFPDVVPDYFIGANGAIAYAERYGKEVVKWGVISNSLLVLENEGIATTRKILDGSCLDNLYIINFRSIKMERFTPYEIFGALKNVTRLSRFNKTIRTLRVIGLTSLANYLGKIPIDINFFSFIKYLLIRQSIKELHLSTGMMSLVIAISEIEKIDKIYLVGIGFEPNSGHFYVRNEIYGSGHIIQDKFFFDHMKKKLMHQIDLLECSTGDGEPPTDLSHKH